MVQGTLLQHRQRSTASWKLSSSWLLVAGALTLAGVACSAPRSSVLDTKSAQGAEVASARRASSTGDWKTAAGEWYAIFQRGGSSSVEACLGAARALRELGDLQSARALVEQGLERHARQPDLLEMQGDLLSALGFHRAA